MPCPRVFVVSDIHTDFEENMEWVRGLSDTKYTNDAIILAGDISDDLSTLEETFTHFASRFRYTFFTPGNHELWCKRRGPLKEGESEADREIIPDSMAKLERVLKLCETCGVDTRPRLLGDGDRKIWVAPIVAWYHSSLDTEPDITEQRVHPPHLVMSDFRLCEWPGGLDPKDESVAEAMDAVNDTRLGWSDFTERLRSPDQSEADANAPIVSFSHFLPRLELCPEKRMLFYPNLPKAVGSDFCRVRIQNLRREKPAGGASRDRTHVHCFGHTHFGWDATIDGVRYIQAPVSYPHEWKQRPGSLTVGPDANGREFDFSGRFERQAAEPCCIFDAETHGGFVPKMSARWSDHYIHNPRTPEDTELAWWVRKSTMMKGSAD